MMSILKLFCDAFEQAIVDYEKEMNGKIPIKRQPVVANLRSLLEDAQREECQRMIWLKETQTLPDIAEIDKDAIYLIPDQNTISVQWYAHGVIETAVVEDEDQFAQIKSAFNVNRIEKSTDPIFFNEMTKQCTYRNRALDTLALREKMVDYLKHMPANFLAFIPLFESRLRTKLKAVLDQPHFSEFRLASSERVEIRVYQKTHHDEVNALKAQITLLQESLKKEQAKDSVQKVNVLTQELAWEKRNTVFLTQENQQLQQNVDQLFKECGTLKAENQKLTQEKNNLQADYDDLRAKYEALLKEKSSQEQSKPNTAQNFFT